MNAIFGTYAHELANMIDYRSGGTQVIPGPHGNETRFGDPNGIPIPESNERDYDTGANVENCMFGSLQQP
jgi:hypothetical protein